MMVKTKGAICGLIMRQVLGSHSSVRSDKPLNKTFNAGFIQYGTGSVFRDVLESLGTHLVQDLFTRWWWTWPPAAPVIAAGFAPVDVVPPPVPFGISLASPVIK